MKDLWIGIRRHPWKAMRHVFVSFSVLWTLTEGLTYFVPGIQIKGLIALGIIIFISISYALNRVWKPSTVDIKVSNSNTTIQVLFGDLFQQDGIRAIAV